MGLDEADSQPQQGTTRIGPSESLFREKLGWGGVNSEAGTFCFFSACSHCICTPKNLPYSNKLSPKHQGLGHMNPRVVFSNQGNCVVDS